MRGLTVKVVYYCQSSALFLPFLHFFQKITGILFVPVVDFVAGEEQTGGYTAYETIHIRLNKIIDTMSNKWVKDKLVSKFARKKKFDPNKIREHLKEAAFNYLYRPIEISVISEIRSNKEDCHFFFRKTPFSETLSKEMGMKSVNFYITRFSHFFTIHKREDYIIDMLHSSTYYSDRFLCVCKLAIYWLLILAKALLGWRFYQINYNASKRTKVNIGVELLQERLRSDATNDLFWFGQSRIDPESVYSIEIDNFDSRSEEIISNFGINRARPFRFSLLHLKRLFANPDKLNSYYFVPDINCVCKTIWTIAAGFLIIFKWDERAWIRFQLVRFNNYTSYWDSIYRQLNIKILSSIIDCDSGKLAKAQAMENVNGLFVGCHWSNFPMYRVYYQKCLDVLFTWGRHFINNNFNRYPFMEIFQTGYPSDHYFEKRRSKAVSLRNQYAGKFILSYQDNITANDLPYSKNMQIQVHEMLLSILKEHDDVVVFIKPKKENAFNAVIKEVPEFWEYIDNGRITTFFGETNRAKVAPAEIGMASDLVVGLGISTTAAECQFAGTLSFHADLTGFRDNEFGNTGLGKIVFRDVDSLKDAITDVIKNGASKKYVEYKKLYSTLDPFQDGKAYKRMGFVMKNLQDLLNRGLSREDTISIAREKYDKFIKETYKEQILC